VRRSIIFWRSVLWRLIGTKWRVPQKRAKHRKVKERLIAYSITVRAAGFGFEIANE
jgi:hypothetical protein